MRAIHWCRINKIHEIVLLKMKLPLKCNFNFIPLDWLSVPQFVAAVLEMPLEIRAHCATVVLACSGLLKCVDASVLE